MNIFALDMSPRLCAQYHVDKHVIKMISETAQILSTNLRNAAGIPTLVRASAKDSKGRMVRILPEDKIVETNDGLPPILDEPYIFLETHQMHPCTVWARETFDNTEWLMRLGVELYAEKVFRYGGGHASALIIKKVIEYRWDSVVYASGSMTPFALAMPDEFKVEDPIQSYRNYYMSGKRHLASWKKRGQPDWWL